MPCPAPGGQQSRGRIIADLLAALAGVPHSPCPTTVAAELARISKNGAGPGWPTDRCARHSRALTTTCSNADRWDQGPPAGAGRHQQPATPGHDYPLGLPPARWTASSGPRRGNATLGRNQASAGTLYRAPLPLVSLPEAAGARAASGDSRYRRHPRGWRDENPCLITGPAPQSYLLGNETEGGQPRCESARRTPAWPSPWRNGGNH